jgi:hypothetical protein
MNHTFKLSPGYISGLTQSDGSFFCSMILSKRHLFGIQFRPKFSITADLNSKYVLDSIQIFFDCGSVIINKKNHTAEYVVEKFSDLYNIIIHHFNTYPIYCAKLHAFELFSTIVEKMISKKNRNLEGRRELLKLALSMNVSSNRKENRLNILFNLLNIIEDKDKQLIPNNKTSINSYLTDDTIAGIIDGDGSVYISFQKDGNIHTGFSITTDKLSRPLLEEIQKRFDGIGSIRVGRKKELVYTVKGLNQIIEILIPFIDKNPLYSERQNHYDKFKQISLILKEEQPLSLNRKLEIIDLAYNMNKAGKHRQLSKTEYLEKITNLNNSENNNLEVKEK